MKYIPTLAVLLASACGGAQAQGSLTVYGLLDLAWVHESGAAAGPINKVTSGVASPSRLGFKGAEDLGGGMSAIFVLENGLQADTGTAGQGGLLFGRQAYVGLRGSAGTLTVGRQYTPQFIVLSAIDPFTVGMAGDAKNLMPLTGNTVSRMDNSVKYATPEWKGLSAELALAAGELSGDSMAGRQFGALAAYARGPLLLRAGYHHRNNDSAAVKGTSAARNLLLTASYDFKLAKAHLAWGANRGPNSAPLRSTNNPYGSKLAPLASTDSRDLLLGLSIPVGVQTLLVSYVHKNDRTSVNQDAAQWGVGYRYALSRRTDLYAAHGHISNRNGAGYTAGSGIETGSGNRATDLGIRHLF
jgi:predicted porin